MIAVELPPDFGALSVTELKIVIVHKNRVNRMPSLPGIAGTGMRKLICRGDIINFQSLVLVAKLSQKRFWQCHDNYSWIGLDFSVLMTLCLRTSAAWVWQFILVSFENEEAGKFYPGNNH